MEAMHPAGLRWAAGCIARDLDPLRWRGVHLSGIGEERWRGWRRGVREGPFASLSNGGCYLRGTATVRRVRANPSILMKNQQINDSVEGAAGVPPSCFHNSRLPEGSPIGSPTPRMGDN
jgi:hypothetical protein